MGTDWKDETELQILSDLNEAEYTFVDFVNEINNTEGEDNFQDEDELCRHYPQYIIDYLWETYLSLK